MLIARQRNQLDSSFDDEPIELGRLAESVFHFSAQSIGGNVARS